MPQAPAGSVVCQTATFCVGAIVSAALVVVPLELVARASNLPSGIEESTFHLFAAQQLAMLLLGHLASAMVLVRRGLPPATARTAMMAGFAAMALQLIALMLSGEALGPYGRLAAAFVTGALATAGAMSLQRKTQQRIPIA